MLDHNWEMINGDAAHAIEVLNYSNQVNVIEALVHYLSFHGGVDPERGCLQCPTERAMQELHRTGTLFLLAKPGEYREEEVHIAANGVVVYVPPVHTEVAEYMRQFAMDLAVKWGGMSAVQIAAFCLWRINWIHPFKNGNGRTARAVAYTCICLKLGFIPGGSPTMIDLIMRNKPEFERLLMHADKTLDDNGVEDIEPLAAFVERLLVEQLSTIPMA
ncbi:Fic family protein [uncultured Sphingomonas sp.]|uniref:Fic family protein n=1 Tax=uncultured Sphingomonas sp. TaxID=158754 RepID=UPI0025DF95A9|nr:Fic family protein [uncultured Sphingomonas sp.]